MQGRIQHIAIKKTFYMIIVLYLRVILILIWTCNAMVQSLISQNTCIIFLESSYQLKELNLNSVHIFIPFSLTFMLTILSHPYIYIYIYIYISQVSFPSQISNQKCIYTSRFHIACYLIRQPSLICNLKWARKEQETEHKRYIK
jgi:hypothetical protein